MSTYPRIVGVLFLGQFISGVLYHQFLVGNFIFAEDLSTISEHKQTILLGVFLQLIASIGDILAGVLLYQLLKKYSFFISTWYLIFITIAFIINLSNGIDALIICDSKFSEITLIALVREHYYWTHMISILLPIFVFPPFFYILFKNGLVPKWISGIGFVGSILLPATIMAGIFGLGESVLLMLPLAFAQLALSIYLIIYGFKNYDYAQISN